MRRKFTSLFAIALCAITTQAQFKVQGIPYAFSSDKQNSAIIANTTMDSSTELFTTEDIEFWVGEGENESVMVIQTNADGEENALAWGYRWSDETTTGADMLLDVIKADPRLVAMVEETSWGTTFGGIGYDANGDGVFSITKDGVTYTADEDGIIIGSNYNYDDFTASEGDFWGGGWNTGYWSYYVKDNDTADWGYASTGASGRTLVNEAWDGWNFAAGFGSYDWKEIVAAPMPTVEPAFTAEDIEFWVGEGENESIFVVQFNTAGEENAMAWGYRWSGEATGADMLLDIAAADSRLIVMSEESSWGTSLNAIGYDADGDGYFAISKDGITYEAINGVIEGLDSYDGFTVVGNDLWAGGSWTGDGYWSYYVKGDASADWGYASTGASGRTLTDGDWDAWSFSPTGVYDYVWKTIVAAEYTEPVAEPFTAEDIEFWVGEGENESIFVVQFNTVGEENAMAWGYRWSGEATGADMLLDIAAADPRLIVISEESSWGTSLNAIGYDADGDGYFAISKDGITYEAVNGVIEGLTSYDGFTVVGNDLWAGGSWTGDGYWSYYVKEDATENWDYASTGASGRALEDGSWDGWNFAANGYYIEWKEIVAAEYTEIVVIDYSNGFFFLNEGQYGKQQGSLNFLSADGEWTYKAYATENPGMELGTTSTYATVYGENIYIMSKQGERLIVADAKTLKNIASIESLAVNSDDSSADGRGFIAVSPEKGYIGSSSGIFIFDMINNVITGSIGDGQVGNMVRVNDYVYAVVKGQGLLVIDAESDEIVTTIDAPEGGDGFGSVVLANDGNLWLSVANGTSAVATLLKVDPKTNETTEIAISDEVNTPANSWFAWTSDAFCASYQEDALYWASASSSFGTVYKVYKYDIDANEFSTVLDLTDSGYSVYGSSFRVDPISDELVLGLFVSYSSQSYKVARYTTDGVLVAEYEMEENYWFPTLPVFNDNDAPSASAIRDLTSEGNNDLVVDLATVASDADNMNAAIVKSVTNVSDESILTATVSNGELVITPVAIGDAIITIEFNSNGKFTETLVSVTVDSILGVDSAVNNLAYVYNVGSETIIGNCEGYTFAVYSVNGTLIGKFTADSNNYVIPVTLANGLNIISGNNGAEKVTLKVIK